MKNALSKISVFSKKIIYLIALIGTVMIALFSTLYYLHMHLVSDEREIVVNSPIIILFVVAELLVLCVLRKILNNCKENSIFLFFIVIYVLLGLFLIFNVDGLLRGDQQIIYEHARILNSGSYEVLENGRYLTLNPVQLGYATYVRLLIKIVDSTKILFVANLIWTAIIYFIIWKISCLVIDSSLCRKYIILLEFSFLPTFFIILYAYGQVPGYSLILLATYFFIRYLKTHNIINMIPFFVFFILACILKNNFMIAGIVFSLVLLFDVLSNYIDWKALLWIPVILVSMVYPARAIADSYRIASGIDFGEGEPISSYFAMGLHWDEYAVTGGGYDGYTFDNYYDSGFDSELADQKAKENLKESINYFVSNPSYAIQFFKYKFIATWCEPLFGTVEIGPLECFGQYTHNIFVQSIYTDGYLYLIAEKFMNAYNIIIFSFCAIFCFRMIFKRKRINGYEVMPALYFIGGMIFHLISETQARYMPIYVVPLIIYVAVVLVKIQDKGLEKINKNN